MVRQHQRVSLLDGRQMAAGGNSRMTALGEGPKRGIGAHPPPNGSQVLCYAAVKEPLDKTPGLWCAGGAIRIDVLTTPPLAVAAHRSLPW